MTRYRSLLWHGQKAPAPGSPVWRSKMTATKVSATFTPSRSPHQSYFKLWHEMAGNLEGTLENDVLQRGRILEPAIAAWFGEQHPEWNVRDPRGRWWVNPTDNRYAATPDRVVEQGGDVIGLLECKSAIDPTGWGKPGTDEIPPHYYDQCQWQMFCTGERVTFVAVILALSFREYKVEYDPGHVRRLESAASKFMDALAAGEAPSVDPDAGHLATYEAVRQLHPEIQDSSRELSWALAAEYVESRLELKAAEAKERAARTRVADAMGSARIATYDGHPVAERRARSPESRPFVQAARNLPTYILTPIDPVTLTNPDNDLTTKKAA
ncbi:YqaJ viral recombinase family protein [Rothia koreensis]|uniref:YqaJ viral recombinase family protein n=1 Tax=Rothia koreensis TaxID=592378 RepID=UPI0037C9EEF2